MSVGVFLDSQGNVRLSTQGPTPGEYIQFGQMFDGRPLFVARGYEVREAECSSIVPVDHSETADTLNVDKLTNLLTSISAGENAQCVVLDREVGNVPDGRWLPMKTRSLVNRRARALVAVRTA